MAEVGCSDDFPTTDVFYAALSGDLESIAFLTVAAILAVVCVGIYIEELAFLHRTHFDNKVRLEKAVTVLGLYPMIAVTSLIALLVPRSTVLVDLISACYLSVCFYAFVALVIDYFGGEDKMIETLSDQQVSLRSPPCCCCCCCILKPARLTKKVLFCLKSCALQVVIIRPTVLFVAAVLWTDGKYTSGRNSASYVAITAISTVSMLVSLYGTIVIVRTSINHLKVYNIRLKFAALQLMMILISVQNFVFAVLANYNLPSCVGVRDSRVRGSAMNHVILVIEAFLLALLARKAYRIDEAKLVRPNFEMAAEDGTTDKPRGYQAVS